MAKKLRKKIKARRKQGKGIGQKLSARLDEIERRLDRIDPPTTPDQQSEPADAQ